MEKKILRYQLNTLFILTTLNLLYFYYRENLPDNFFEINYQNESINFFTYYFFSMLANFGYWCGIWITLSFLTFAILNSLIFTKKKDIKNQIVVAVLLPLTVGICYFTFPTTLGEGLFFLIRENVGTFTLITSLMLLGTSFFYLVSEKHFFKTCKYIAKKSMKTYEAIRTADYSSLEKVDPKAWLVTMKEKVPVLIAKFKRTEAEPKLTITNPPKFQDKPKVETVRPVMPPVAPVAEEVDEDEEEFEAEVETESEIEEETEDDSDDFFADSVDESEIVNDSVDEDEMEEVESPYQRKKLEDKFFAHDELVECLVSKTHTNQPHDPEDTYFHTIAKAIEDKLGEFKISAQVTNVMKGPVVDTFELELGAGVKVAGINNKANDLSLALKGIPIRIVYPLKGKTTIGIEVPRNPRELIFLDEVLQSQNFKESNLRLPISMGKDAYGDATVIDLASTPHFLVAGTTGSGKSVFVNTLLVSLIIKLSPRKLRLILIDPKQLELALYQTLPHLIMPVVTDSSIASVALLWAIDEMERRYSLLKDFGVKNIEGFNKKVKGAGHELLCKINKYYEDADAMDFELSYIVIVVDEFADLVLSKSGKAIENSISRLAAKARASGIHIVLATQRPSTDVITGVIKANFPTRVAFRVTTNTDSRVIMDTPGAEKLLGRGDMLFKQGIDTIRMHSAYVDEEEIDALVKKLSTLPTQYDSKAIEFIENNGSNEDEFEGAPGETDGESLKDEKYDEAVRCVATHRMASASFLQRRLGVGYNRAANLIEEMERQGVVGPGQGSKPRKVLVPPPND
ncbi:MAG: DNA translocase FtsK [Bacteriovoracaceae bacterium]